MSNMNFAYTIPFPKDTKVTQEQAFEALRIKCREPMKFVPMFVACEVLEETPTTMKRKATTTTGEVLLEDMELYKPTLVTFRADNGNFVTNSIAETSDGSLLLAFTFSFTSAYVLKNDEPGTEAANVKIQEMKAALKGVVGITMQTILELCGTGKLN